MNLNSKYFAGLILLVIIGGIFFFFDPFVSLNLPIGLYYIGFGVLATIIGIIFYILLFSPERIKGYQAEYEVSPDLTKFTVVRSLKHDLPSKSAVPEIAYCSACGKQIYKPFHCSKCGQLLCGEHYIHGAHNCTE
jgi:predicted nucleic acid binding AN1-type Zn finger protein